MINQDIEVSLNPPFLKTAVGSSTVCNVVSLFDGMSCLQLALNSAGIKPTKYYASEIDKYAMQVTMANFPNTIQIGDVRNIKGSDLGFIHILGGGSPCQSFSFAGKRKGMATKCDIEILTLSHYLELKSQNFEFEGQSYLFWEYMRILEELRVINPNIKFLLENVLMGEKWQKILTRAIGINPIKINSALLSAQNRQRLYWTNIASVQDGLFGDLVCSIPQAKDKGILLKDILQTDVADKYFLSGKMLDYLNSRKANYNNGKINYKNENDIASCINASSGSLDISDNIIIDTNRKARCFTAGGNSGGLHSQMDLVVHNTMPRSSKTGKGGTGPLSRNDGKTYCLDTGNTNAIEMVGAIKFGRTDEAKAIRKESIKNGKDFTPFQAKEISNIDYEKMGTLTTAINKDNLLIVAQRGRGINNEQQLEPRSDGKTNCLTSVQKDNLVISGTLRTHNDGKGFREVVSGKGATIPARAREDGSGQNIVSVAGNIRRLTPIECERLQTVPDNYTNHVSDTQRYRMLGNGWTIDVIAYIFSYLRFS
jgi:site-specific DNA-cytosine methylase